MFMLFALFIFMHFSSSDALHSFNWKSFFKRETKDYSLAGVIKDKVFLGSKVKIPCVGEEDSPVNVAGYKWEKNKIEISDSPAYEIDSDGALTINSVKLRDAGTFICTATVDTNLIKWKHEIKVVQMPSIGIHVYFVYSLKNCSNDTEDIAQEFIESKLKGKVCTRKECRVSSVHSSCHFEELLNPVLRVTVALVAPEVPTGSCNEDCTRSKLIHLEEKVKREIAEIITKDMGLKVPGQQERFLGKRSISSFDSDKDTICDPGFEINEENATAPICVACTPGHFIEKGRCIPCHLNQYTDKYGATECRFCDHDRKTNKRGGKSEDDCKFASLAALWIVLIIALFPSITCVTCCCWVLRHFAGETTIARCIDTCCYIILCDCQSLKGPSTKSDPNPSEEQLIPSIKNSNLDEEPKPDITSVAYCMLNSDDPIGLSQNLEQRRDRMGHKRKGRVSQVFESEVPPVPPPHPTQSQLKRATRERLFQNSGDADSSDPSPSVLHHKYIPFSKTLDDGRQITTGDHHQPIRKRLPIHSIFALSTKTMKNRNPYSFKVSTEKQGDASEERNFNWIPCGHDGKCRLFMQPDANGHKTTG